MSGVLTALGAIGAGFNPKSISNLQLWFDGSDSSTITLGTPPAIAAWADKSGNGNNATQSTAGNRPTVDSAAQNGLSAVKFVSGSSQNFALTNPLSVTTGYTSFTVCSRVTTGSEVVPLGSSSTANCWMPAWTVISTILVSGLTSRADSSAQALTAFTLISCGQNASENNGFIRVNLSDVTSNANDTGTTCTQTGIDRIGFTTSLGGTDGDIAEFILYSAVLTLVQIQAVENYLRAKWATP